MPSVLAAQRQLFCRQHCQRVRAATTRHKRMYIHMYAYIIYTTYIYACVCMHFYIICIKMKSSRTTKTYLLHTLHSALCKNSCPLLWQRHRWHRWQRGGRSILHMHTYTHMWKQKQLRIAMRCTSTSHPTTTTTQHPPNARSTRWQYSRR